MTTEDPTPPSIGWPDRDQGSSLLVAVGLGVAALALQCCAGCPLGILESELHESIGLEQGSIATHPISLALTSLFALGTVLFVGTRLARIPARTLIPLRRFPLTLLPGLVFAVLGGSVVTMELATVQELVMPMPAKLIAFLEQAIGGDE